VKPADRETKTMSANSSRAILGLAAALILLPAGAARADRIDGNWCLGDGHRMQIEGPRIVTPGGKQMQGDYSRHAFSYRVPESEPGAGALVSMVLLDEDTVRLTLASAPGAPAQGPEQVWRRCPPATS
jgi:hypothetical protein